jgi:hypothetical protein
MIMNHDWDRNISQNSGISGLLRGIWSSRLECECFIFSKFLSTFLECTMLVLPFVIIFHNAAGYQAGHLSICNNQSQRIFNRFRRIPRNFLYILPPIGLAIVIPSFFISIKALFRLISKIYKPQPPRLGLLFVPKLLNLESRSFTS